MRHRDSEIAPRDHGGGVDKAAAQWGGARGEWLDLSTGINPFPYAIPAFDSQDWTALPDTAAMDSLRDAARAFWKIPSDADIVCAPGASALIAALPTILSGNSVHIPQPTYNEHAAAFTARGWNITEDEEADARVLVHPNNPNGRLWSLEDLTCKQTIIDESFADTCPERSLIHRVTEPGGIVLKSFGKFWGLAGLRLGFAVAPQDIAQRLNEAIGPWAVSGPALKIGAMALRDSSWAVATRMRLAEDSQRMDALVSRFGGVPCGGTPLFRLYETQDAAAFQDHLAGHQIWSRIFPYSKTWVRLGLPPEDGWPRLEKALSA